VEPLAQGVMEHPRETVAAATKQGFTKRVFDWGEDLHEDLLTLNMGPQHPSTHGVLRIVLTLDGEIIVHAEPVVGYLHRAKEKMAENLTYLQFIPHTDRLDYLAPQINNVAMCLAVEKLCGLTVPPRGQAIRVVISELMRIMSHLIYIGTTALDIGAATVFFHAFREREQIYDIIDRITGQRMNNSFIRVGGVGNDIDDVAIAAVRDFTKSFPVRVDEYETLLTKNRIWWERNRDIGVITKEQAFALSLTGPILRASGVEHDLRRRQPYLGYEQYDFEIPVGAVGDCYDRYLVRIEEMRQSNSILVQALDKLPAGEVYVEDRRYVMPPKERVFDSMEELIYQFKVVTDMKVPAGEVYSAVEGTKGELGFYIVSRGENKPHRLHVRSPSFINLQALPELAQGRYVSDLVAIIGSLDFVMGEVDR
jgi:NADH-quinone oxidoreductase subunit D